MQNFETNIIILKDKIVKQKRKINSIKIQMDNDFNTYSYGFLAKLYDDAKKELLSLEKELINENTSIQREKLIYKKSLSKIKDSINEFHKLTKNNSVLKKHTQEMIIIINNIDKYL